MLIISGPPDATAYKALRDEVEHLIRLRQGAAALPKAEELTRLYPRDGRNWALLARVQGGVDRHGEAARSYLRAAAIYGWDVPWRFGTSAASEFLKAGDKEAALRTLRHLVFVVRTPKRSNLYDNPDFQSLRADPEFLRIAGRPEARSSSRTAGWRSDMTYLRREIRRVVPLFRDRPLPADFEPRFRALWDEVPGLTDNQVFVRLNGLLATLHLGHTGLWYGEDGGSIKFTQVPLQFWLFPEGVFVVRADARHQALIGSRLLSIAATPAETALHRVAGVLSADGDMQYVESGELFIGTPAVLNGLGIIPSAGVVPMSFRMADGSVRSFELKPDPAPGNEKLPAPIGVTPPLYLANLDKLYWMESLPEHDALYVQVNAMADDAGETLSQFGERVQTELARSGARNVIVDVRHNDGGGRDLYQRLLRTLIAFSTVTDHHTWVLTSRVTYSAAGTFITDLEQLARPTFIGEAAAECCQIHGEAARIRLPYSKLLGRLPGFTWNRSYPTDERRELSPDYPVTLHATQYFAGDDPVLQTAFDAISASASETRPKEATGSMPAASEATRAQMLGTGH